MMLGSTRRWLQISLCCSAISPASIAQAQGVAVAEVAVVKAPDTSTPAEPASDPPARVPPATDEPPAQTVPATLKGPIPEQRISYDVTVGARLNPLGLEALYNIAYRHRLYASDSAALRDNYFGVVLAPTINPAITRFGVALEFRPLSMLAFSGGVHQVGYVGSFKHLQSAPDGSQDYSDTGRGVRGDAGENHPTHGLEAFARVMAIVKLGPIVIRDELMFTYSKLMLPDGDEVYYHPRFDVLAPDSGWIMHNDSDILYLTDFGLAAGARASVDATFIPEEVEGGKAGEDNSPFSRVGPMAAFMFFDDPGASFNKPTLIAISQWWLQHRFRTSQDVSQAIPMVTLAFRFEGDLFLDGRYE